MPSEGWVRQQFRVLSAAERREFLAAVWAVRGYETSVEDAVVLVRDEAARVHDQTARVRDDALELRVVGRWPWRDHTADVVVGLYDTDRARKYAAAREAEFVTPATLAQLLLYGIERSEAEQITREYFGTALSEAPSTQASSRLSSSVLGVLTVVVIAIVAASLGSVPTTSGGPPQVSGSAPDAEIQTTDGSEMAIALPGTHSCTGRVPGPDSNALSRNGTIDAERLADIHQKQLAEQPQRVTLTYTGPRNTSFKSGVVRDRLSFRSNGTHTRYVRTRTIVTDSDETIEWNADVYVDEQGFWIHRNGETRSLHRHIWDDFQRALVWPYHSVLRDTELNVTEVRPFGTQFYRATVRSESAQRRNFSAVAYLTPCQEIEYLSISYVHAETGEPVSLEIVYDDLDRDDSIPAPSWYPERVDG
jgi:hypothetical protein